MARSKKLTLDFFIHDANASSNPKIRVLDKKHGNDGYATFFRLLERLCQVDGIQLDLKDYVIVEVLAEDFRLRDGHHLLIIIQSCVELGLLDKQLWESERVVFSPGLYQRYQSRLEERKEAAERMKRKREIESLSKRLAQLSNCSPEQSSCSLEQSSCSPQQYTDPDPDPDPDPDLNNPPLSPQGGQERESEEGKPIESTPEPNPTPSTSLQSQSSPSVQSTVPYEDRSSGASLVDDKAINNANEQTEGEGDSGNKLADAAIRRIASGAANGEGQRASDVCNSQYGSAVTGNAARDTAEGVGRQVGNNRRVATTQGEVSNAGIPKENANQLDGVNTIPVPNDAVVGATDIGEASDRPIDQRGNRATGDNGGGRVAREKVAIPDDSYVRTKHKHPTQKTEDMLNAKGALPPWRTGQGPNQYLDAFVDYLVAQHLPTVNPYKGVKKPTKGNARSWILDREYDEQGIAKIENQFEDFEDAESRKQQQSSTNTPNSMTQAEIDAFREQEIQAMSKRKSTNA